MSFDGVVRGVKDDDLNSPHDAQRYQLGSRHFKNGNEYVYVYNAGGSSIGTGKYCVLDGGANSLSSGYSVTVTNASLTGRMAGVAQSTLTAAQYGFVMTRGTSLVACDAGEISCNVGVDLCLGTDGGFRPVAASLSVGEIFAHTMNSFVTTVGTSKARIFDSLL